MCFAIHEKYPRAKIAEKNVRCFKVVTEKSKHVYDSLHKNFRYEVGNEYDCERRYGNMNKFAVPGTSHNLGDLSVSVGFHSFTTLRMARRNSSRGRSIVEFHIPFGSMYFYNPDLKEYVSERIVCGTPKRKPRATRVDMIREAVSVLRGKATFEKPKKDARLELHQPYNKRQ